jgi:hypothetical protein
MVMLTEKDEGRHPAGQGEKWNESYYFNFYDPETRIGGVTRMGLQENIRKSNLWFFLIKEGKVCYSRFRLDLPYNPNGLEGITVGDLTYQMTEPLKTFKIAFKDRDTELDLIWEGYHPILEFGGSKQGIPQNVASTHYEQYGEVRGTLDIKGAKHQIHGFGFRDHSWGTRDWEGVQHWRAVTGQFGRDWGFTALEMISLDGRSVKKGGFIFDGDDNLAIKDLEIKVEFDSDGTTQKSVDLTLIDEKGRDTRITGTRIANCQMPYDCNMINEAMFSFHMGSMVGYGLFEYNFRT